MVLSALHGKFTIHHGNFLNWQNSFLEVTPDGVLVCDYGEFGIVEVKCPYKHGIDYIVDACKDSEFYLELGGGQA